MVRGWPEKATTDLEQIRRWWRMWPNANLATPTGQRSGLLVVDVDHPAGLEALEQERGKLPATTTTATGSGGRHFFYRYPAGVELRNTAGKLAPSVDTRGAGGFALLPPSRTTGPYEWLDRRPLAAPPQWLIQALTDTHRPRSGGVGPGVLCRGRAALSDSPGRIGVGKRNDTLFRHAARLRGRGAELPEIMAELEDTNARWCEEPLPADELERIAQSAARYPAGKAGTPNRETLEALVRVETELWCREWRGMGELSSRDVFVALIKLARDHGERVPAGVRVSVSVRALALAAAVSKPTAIKAARRLREAGLIRKDDAARKGPDAGAYVLLDLRANVDHSTTRGDIEPTRGTSGKGLRAPLTAPRLRWSGPRFDRVGDEMLRSTVRRLGKGSGAVIDALERAGGSATVGELADTLHKRRPRDLRRRVIPRLEAAGVVEVASDTVTLADDWLQALNLERELTGEIAAFRRDMARYDRERQAYRDRRRIQPERAPAPGETRRHRETLPDRRRAAITAALARLFADRPEYRGRRAGQITCKLPDYLQPDFPRGPDGLPKDREVEELLDGVAA